MEVRHVSLQVHGDNFVFVIFKPVVMSDFWAVSWNFSGAKTGMEHSNFDPLFILKRTFLKLFDPIDNFALKLNALTNSDTYNSETDRKVFSSFEKSHMGQKSLSGSKLATNESLGYWWQVLPTFQFCHHWKNAILIRKTPNCSMILSLRQVFGNRLQARFKLITSLQNRLFKLILHFLIDLISFI